MLHISTANANGHYQASTEDYSSVESPLNASPDEEQYKQQQQQQIQRKQKYKKLRTVAFIVFTISISIVCLTLAIFLAIFLGKATNGHHDYPDLKATTSLTPVLTTLRVNISRPTAINVSQITTQEPLEGGYVSISGMLTIDLPFTDDFNDNTSDEYITLEGHFNDTVDTIFKGSEAIYDHTIVTGLERHGHTTNLYFSIKVNAELQEQLKVFIGTALQDEKIGEIKILYVEINPAPPGRGSN